MSKAGLAVVLIAALPAGTLGGAWWLAPRLYEDDLATAFPHREAEWAGSTTCESCHPDHYASWHRTFHRTMTQEATPETVLGAFDGQRLVFGFRDAAGRQVTARPYREDGRFVIELRREDGTVQTFDVHRTVGSRRYQQYLSKAPASEPGENYYRLPVLWNVRESRWIHLNGAFLGHDGEPYDQHMAVWNQNCIFCHNTGPRPGWINYRELDARAARGEPVNSAVESRYESEVAELGIACEACHAPAGEHARRNRDPLRRYLLHLSGGDDPTIVNPAKLAKERSVDVCGQCHGQRLPDPPDSIRDWMIDGPVYRAGETLTASLDPVTRDTPGPPSMPDMFARRFWNDGTPRLTAYEYQGLVASPCFQKGELTCLSCHSMHAGDLRGQIEPAMRTNDACAPCHQELMADVKAHTRHEPEGSGSLCYECHMPRMVYGVLEIHRSHLIENPDPAADAEAARPNACTLCHLDRSAVWAAEKSREWWGSDAYRIPERSGDGAPVELADTAAALLAGDPVQRAVAARLAGRGDAPLKAGERAFLVPLLLQGLQDRYPTIRWFSQLSLRSLLADVAVPGMTAALERFDYLAPPPQRQVVTAELLGLWQEHAKSSLPAPPEGSLVGPDYRLTREAAAPLLALQTDKLIHIGE
jgi:hypothetical protein